MKKPKQVFTNTDSLWAFYNFVTNALQYSHPKTWMEDQRILHFFIGTICNLSAPVQPVSAPVPDLTTPPQDLSAPVEEVDPLYVIPNQTNILDQIADLEADQIDEDVRYAAAELADNQVVQEEVINAEVLHQLNGNNPDVKDPNEAEENVLTEDELAHDLYGVDNDIEVSIPGPCAAHDAETEKEEFLSLEPSLEDIQAYEEQEQKEYMEPVEANLDLVEEVNEEIKEDDNSDFDLDFGISKDDEDSSNIPDFF
jgi:hypothetical protein